MEVECKHYNHFMDHSSIKCNSYQIDTVPVSISSMQHCQTSYPPQGCNCLRSITFSFHTGIFPCQDAPTIYISQSIHPWCQCPGDPVDWSAFLDNSWTHGRHWGAIIGQLTKGRHVYNLSWRYSCFSSPCTWEWGFLGVMCTYVSAFSWMSVSNNGVECANYHTFQKDVDVCKLPWQLCTSGHQHLETTCMLWSHSLGLHFNGLNQFLSFLYLIWSFQTSNHEEPPYGNSLISCPSSFHKTHVCLMANPVLSNLTLFLTVHFCAVHGYCYEHCYFSLLLLAFNLVVFPPSNHSWAPYV